MKEQQKAKKDDGANDCSGSIDSMPPCYDISSIRFNIDLCNPWIAACWVEFAVSWFQTSMELSKVPIMPCGCLS